MPGCVHGWICVDQKIMVTSASTAGVVWLDSAPIGGVLSKNLAIIILILFKWPGREGDKNSESSPAVVPADSPAGTCCYKMGKSSLILKI